MFQLAIVVALTGISVLLAGCGGISQAGSAAQGAGTPTLSASESQTATASGQPTSGKVTLTLDKQGYTAREMIVVTVENGLSKTIWAEDHHTSCTTLVAEHAQGAAWAAIENCHSLRPTTLAPLSAGATSVRLDTSGWPTGTYRITLTYSGGDEGAGGPGGAAHSAEFTVG
jgi:hypothetical protein